MSRKRNPFVNNRIDCLPFLEFIEKYPHFGFNKRFEIFKEIGFNCVQCGIIGSHVVWWQEFGELKSDHYDIAGFKHNDPNNELIMITIDHIWPKSKGGANAIWNYQPMCSPCNGRKSDKVYTDKPKWMNNMPPSKSSNQ